MSRLASEARTDVGLKRKNNQDSYFIDDSLSLFLVADGMGGLDHGEVASAMVAQTISSYIQRFKDRPLEDPERYDCFDSSLNSLENTIMQGVQLANRTVYDTAHDYDAFGKMGSTLVLIMADGSELIVVHVGDSRIYRFQGEEMEQLTIDHSLQSDPMFNGIIDPESTMVSSMGKTLTRGMGIKPEVRPDLKRIPINDDDLYLLATDGLMDMVSDEMIAQVLGMHIDIKKKVDHLIELALAGGGRDNVTVVLVEPRSYGDSLKKLFGRK